MCTAIRFTDHSQNCYFGRNLDWECGYGEGLVITPAGWEGAWRFNATSSAKHPVMGIGICQGQTPLYYDCMNDQGLAVAGLLFSGFANYEPKPVEGKINLAAYEFPLWLCREFASVSEIEGVIRNVAIVGVGPGELAPSMLHWMIADNERSIVVEYLADGMHVHENTVDVLTNQPCFDWHLEHLRSYFMLGSDVPPAASWGRQELSAYGTGAGMRGLPGDYYSPSRFVRIAYLNANYPTQEDEAHNVTRLFRSLEGVAMIEGASKTVNGLFEKTLYTSGYSTKTLTCYYSTYDDPSIREWCLKDFDISGTELLCMQ